MAWVNLDDQFFSHPKVAHLMIEAEDGLRAIGLWAIAITWAHCYTRDKPPDEQGVIPARMVQMWDRSWGRAVQAASDLCDAELWVRMDDGSYRIHQFREWNGLEQREAKARGGRMTAAKRWGTPLFDDDADSTAIAVASSSPIASNGSRATKSRVAETGSSGVARVAPPTPTPTPTLKNHSSSADDAFTRFWAVYPRRVGKEAARRSWLRATRGTRDSPPVDPEVIIVGAIAYGDERGGKDPKFTPHPATWLNQGRWQDDDPATDEAGIPPWQQPGYVPPERGFGQ